MAFSVCTENLIENVKSYGMKRYLKDSLNGKLSFFTHFSKFVVFIRVM